MRLTPTNSKPQMDGVDTPLPRGWRKAPVGESTTDYEGDDDEAPEAGRGDQLLTKGASSAGGVAPGEPREGPVPAAQSRASKQRCLAKMNQCGRWRSPKELGTSSMALSVLKKRAISGAKLANLCFDVALWFLRSAWLLREPPKPMRTGSA